MILQNPTVAMASHAKQATILNRLEQAATTQATPDNGNRICSD